MDVSRHDGACSLFLEHEMLATALIRGAAAFNLANAPGGGGALRHGLRKALQGFSEFAVIVRQVAVSQVGK